MSPILNNWLKEVQITFKIIFQKDYMTIPLVTSFLIYLPISNMFKVMCEVGCEHLVILVHLVIPFFRLP